jgi:hypothetical protein
MVPIADDLALLAGASMRNILLLLGILALLSPGSVQAQTDGPFGVTMGSQISRYPGCEPAPTPAWYACTSLPKSHPSFDGYQIQAHPVTGVCYVKAVGKRIDRDPYGIRLRSEIETLATQIMQTYGRHSEIVDHLVPNSIWKDPERWMIAVQQGQRNFSYEWHPGRAYPNNVDKVSILATGMSSQAGYVVVEFYFKNVKDCDDAINTDASKAF